MRTEDQSPQSPILVVGSYVPGSGFARVMSHVIAGIRSVHPIHYFGVDFDGPPHLDGEVQVHPGRGTPDDPYGCRKLRDVAAAVRPRLVFILHDLWYQARYLSALEAFRGELKVVTYTPVDGDILSWRSLQPLRLVDRCIFYTGHGRRGVERFLAEWHENAAPDHTPGLGIIPHGVDTATFHPWPGTFEDLFEGDGRLRAKQAVFPEEKDLAGSFIVLNANRPSPRKRIDVTMAGFALFAQGKPANVKLYLHHTKVTPRLRSEVLEVADEMGIRDRVLVNPIVEGKAEVDDERLNLIYNACDVGVNTAMGEGWGLVSFEHAATGAPQIVPRHTACAELWEGAAAFLDPVADGKPWFSPYKMYAVAPEELAERLEELYQDRARRRELALAGYRRATEPRFQWPRISQQWTDLFRDALAA